MYSNDIDQITYVELDSDMMNNPVCKNEYIRNSVSEYIVFINTRYAVTDEVKKIIADNMFFLDYECTVFGENVSQGLLDFKEVIGELYMNPYVLIVKRDILSCVGCFNEYIEYGDIYEWILRVAYECYKDSCKRENERVYNGMYGVICNDGYSDIEECDGRSDSAIHNSGMTNKVLMTYAYVIRKYMEVLRQNRLLENVLNSFLYNSKCR